MGLGVLICKPRKSNLMIFKAFVSSCNFLSLFPEVRCVYFLGVGNRACERPLGPRFHQYLDVLHVLCGPGDAGHRLKHRQLLSSVRGEDGVQDRLRKVHLR